MLPPEARLSLPEGRSRLSGTFLPHSRARRLPGRFQLQQQEFSADSASVSVKGRDPESTRPVRSGPPPSFPASAVNLRPQMCLCATASGGRFCLCGCRRAGPAASR